ncbi:serine/threonine-protein kinase Sgk3 [Brienomyrus brachyistius]|uniref:serine/threonine-protein kinase Sgk3 n=1 Tax=Brienomyrus brachyistius TaxID=42636 RepID=UPI0020B2995A|nr:serine/threonine-protein kinase Sgk3 [Brienomyrus brachyistius]XP_048832793.1 serine/threonine-protein kinase Sgk3 [Brienomyrus brachyistius]
MEQPSCPSVSIPCHDEHRDKKKRYTVYKVLVSVGRDEWFVFRRYAEFDKLHNTLRKLFPSMNLKIPSKRIFGDNFDPEFLKQRKTGLNEFIQRIVSHPQLSSRPEVRSFLLMDRLKRWSDASEDEEEKNSSTSRNINLGPSGNPHAKPTDFDFLKVIGKGSFGKVFLAKHRLDGKYYAIKVLQKRLIVHRREQKHIMAERSVLLKSVKHPFLVGLHYSFQTADKLYLVLDFINGGELFFHLQRERTFPEPRARFYVAEIASALGYLHSLNIIYRDLKPENILLDFQGHVVLTDFGLCKEGMGLADTTSTFCGTPEYLAPEVLRKQPYDNTVDWWCLGSVLYEMLFGLPPFYSRDTHEMYDNILHQALRMKPGASCQAEAFLRGLLQKERTLRLGCHGDFNEIKKQSFFSSIDWDALEKKLIEPPFRPTVSSVCDTANFDLEFTEESVTNSVRYPIVNASVLDADDTFLGFSYAPPTDDSFL